MTFSELTYLLTPRIRVLPEKLTVFQPVKKFSTFYWTRSFITAFARARHLFVSWASLIQPIPPYPTFWRSILILLSNLSSHLRLGFPGGLFPSGFPANPLVISPIRVTCHAHLILLDFITRTIMDTHTSCKILNTSFRVSNKISILVIYLRCQALVSVCAIICV